MTTHWIILGVVFGMGWIGGALFFYISAIDKKEKEQKMTLSSHQITRVLRNYHNQD